MLVRHGATDWAEEGRHTGWTDIALNGAGRRQAEALVAPLRARSFGTVLSSPLQRARATSELAGLGGRAELDDDLREWSYGDYEGRTAAEIRAERPGWNIWDHGVVGGESLEQVAARADRVLERVRDLGGGVVLFAHGHLLRVLAARWIGQPPALGRHLSLSTASLSELAAEHGRASIALWNSTAHLQPLG